MSSNPFDLTDNVTLNNVGNFRFLSIGMKLDEVNLAVLFAKTHFSSFFVQKLFCFCHIVAYYSI